jgi:N-glycosylase/DNA lyase
MPPQMNATLTQVVDEYSRLMDSFIHQIPTAWYELSETQLWEELCLCILSSNVPYELALSAFQHLNNITLLNPQRIVESPTATTKIESELSKRIYLPQRKDGSMRRYRFPHVRAKNIVDAAKSLYCGNRNLSEILWSSHSETKARKVLVENVPGIGLKQASHFLRNIGYSSQLAIIDSHVISFLREVGVIGKKRIKTVTPKVYTELEALVIDLSNDLGLNLSVFDMAIWRYMRGNSK